MELTRQSAFWQRAERAPERRILTETDGTTWTAGALLARSNALVHGLRSTGMDEGDAVVAVAGNTATFLVTYLAALQAGFYFVPLNENLTVDELQYVLSNSAARSVVATPSAAARVHDAAVAAGLQQHQRLMAGVVDGFTDLQAFLDVQPTSTPPERTAGAFMPYTSGTTGRPKGIRRRLTGLSPDVQWGEFASWQLGSLGVDIEHHGAHLVTSPMYHTAVISLAGCSLHVGHEVVLMERFDARETLRRMQDHSITTTHMVPTQFHRMLALDPATREEFDLSSLQAVIHGAAPCPLDVKRRMIDWLGPVIYEYYGASEAGGTVVTSQEWLERPGTVGRPYESAEIRIFDDEGNDVPVGEVGRVFIRMGDHDFEYHSDPEKTSAARIGRFVTAGDLGHLDEDGYLFLRGRTAEVIISGGVNIYPAEIEGALLSHPAVEDTAVIGAADDEWGEAVVAAITLHSGWAADDTTRAALLEHCSSLIAKYKLPRRIEFVDSLPRDPNGKMVKPKVRLQLGLAP